jgi:hypothetical protein
MFKLNFISEENNNLYFHLSEQSSVNELPDFELEDTSAEYVDLSEYLSEGNDIESVISWSTEIDYDTKTITINGEIEEEYEDWGYSFDVYDIESALRDITDKFNITWKEASLLDEDGEEQW